MQPFTKMNGIVVPIDRANVDTDAIIPKQYLKSIGKTGFGPNLFDDWRYLDPGEPYMDHSTRRANPECILNQARFQGAKILLARDNYGCGSSREHAVWAMVDYGIRVVIAPSFADIFFNNTLNNGLLAITLEAAIVERLFAEVADTTGYALTVDLEQTTITTPSGEILRFEIEAYRRKRLLAGLDDIGITLLHADAIRDYEAKRKKATPWLF
ncbi:3-isopropylmalate dehydratase small subunit [uncultured Vibrio sp.]|uniref:3-isopropylmalate dehydratase small subunit n=1 Tax=uncultured Vibrio sp. TaxID=114054 RepID=UPI002AA81FFB|nr:3-isopropylmalate dehydratase small subunit [uncultured Vibrio sp.]